MSEFTEAELEAYLDETLDSERASLIESQLSNDSELLARLSHINGRRDAGITRWERFGDGINWVCRAEKIWEAICSACWTMKSATTLTSESIP